MKTIISLPNTKERILPEEFQKDDNRFSESLVEYFLKEFTKKGDKVLDIFSGLGTTLFVAEKLERIPYGIEFDQKRCNYVREHLKNKSSIINGDALKLLDYNLPECDFLLTSPPYMPKNDDENPFTAYTTKGNYTKYLEDYEKIFSLVKRIMKPQSHIIVEIANLKNEGIVTTLAWDVANRISKVLHFEGEIIINWEGEEREGEESIYGYGYDHSYCLVFRNK